MPRDPLQSARGAVRQRLVSAVAEGAGGQVEQRLDRLELQLAEQERRAEAGTSS